MEYDQACAAKWASKTSGATIYAGDQADPELLGRFLRETGGGFDVIVDDGGHTMTQQITSLEWLWPAVKPGGMYFIEDLETSYLPNYGGDGSGGRDPNVHTTAKYIHDLVDDLNTDRSRHNVSEDMRSIECMKQVCLFVKKEEGTV